MSKNYNCEVCKKTYSKESEFTKHQKTTCNKKENIDESTKLINVFKNCLNILRDNEGLTGDKALRTLSYLLILKLLEPHFGGEINIDEYKYDFSHIEDDLVEKHKTKLLQIVRFTNLSKEKEENIATNMKYLWEDILSNHPTTKNIFLKDKGFEIQYKSTYKKLIDKLNSLDLSNTEYDILGNAYEEVIQDIMTGKVLGQFFTQPVIKKMMVKLINPKIYPDGKIESCGDPTMGTGGFLITYLQYIMEQAKIKNIKLDWNYIKNEGIYGKEIDPDTYQLAVSNMLISSGHMFEKLERGDSIREPITRKFDNILANPPYGIKGLKYDDFSNNLKSEYVPIQTDNAVSLFLQAIIYMLKIEGKCAIVLPDGKDLSSKNNNTLIKIREYLMKTCDLKEVIYLPAGIFTYTTIKTCIFYFVKKREGKDVIEKNKNTTKKQKKEYILCKDHKTTKVEFYNYDTEKDIKKLLVEVPIEKIVSNSYSLNYSEYINNIQETKYITGVEMKTLEDICCFLPKSKRNAKYGKKEGKYPFFKSSNKIDSYVDEPDYEEESLIIGDGGEPNINYGIKFSTSDHCYVLQNNDKKKYNLKYVYYYIYNNLDIMAQLYKGAGIKNISKLNIKNIKIPIPPYEKQLESVKNLDKIYEENKELERKIEDNKKKAFTAITEIFKENKDKIKEEVKEEPKQIKKKAVITVKKK
jgi:type I restriction enzyme M protein